MCGLEKRLFILRFPRIANRLEKPAKLVKLLITFHIQNCAVITDTSCNDRIICVPILNHYHINI